MSRLEQINRRLIELDGLLRAKAVKLSSSRTPYRTDKEWVELNAEEERLIEEKEALSKG